MPSGSRATASASASAPKRPRTSAALDDGAAAPKSKGIKTDNFDDAAKLKLEQIPKQAKEEGKDNKQLKQLEKDETEKLQQASEHFLKRLNHVPSNQKFKQSLFKLKDSPSLSHKPSQLSTLNI